MAVGLLLKQIKELKPYAKNSRTHTTEQIKQVANSIKHFGFTNPVLFGRGGVIIAGHCRVLAAKELGLTEVPAIDLSHMTNAQAQAYLIADNQLALKAGWEHETLKGELSELDDLGFDLKLLGFDTNELNALLGYAGSSGKDSEVSENDFSNFAHTCPKCGFEYD